MLAGPPGPGELLRRRGVVDRVLPVEGVRALDEAAVAGALRASPDVLPPGRCVDLAANLHGRGPQSARALRTVLDERGTAGALLVGHRCAAAGLDGGPEWDGDAAEVDRWVRLVVAAGGPCSADDLVLPPAGPGVGTGAGPRAGAGEVSSADGTGVGDHLRRLAGAVVLHPGAASGSRRWPVDRWAALAARLLADGHRVVLTGAGAETELTGEVVRRTRAASAGAARTGGPDDDAGPLVDLAGRCDLEQLADLMARARALVCGDTGVAHLATALRTPSVLLFGPTSPAAWGPAVDRDRHAVLWPAPDAGYRGDPHADAVDPVLARTGVDDVLAALRALPSRPAA
ncbi:glycosyltransferase family 9 protein [uncultured Pseudokineococcus sp.]|uniref:glycosyltransferase family 9 protein n=1 Tax=uncultured Pseudokineococcus sp. TaxID=1642928 RepID=UPI002622E633|nr:glycosyltransferase family 9 protein [uncultured Pseudokineococcus sp.]